MKSLFKLTLLALIVGFIGFASGFEPIPFIAVVAIIGLVRLIIGNRQSSVVANTSIDITALAAALGAYHREHRDELVTEILLDDDFTQDMEVMDDVTDELPLPSMALTDLIKPADPVNFTPTANALAFGARTLKVRGIKVDLLLIPQVLEKTWLGKMKSAKDPVDMPFEAFIMSYINSKIKENLRLQAIYRGVYNAAGTTPLTTMDGYLKLIADEITATNIAPIVTGAVTSANVVDKIEQTYDGLGEAYKGASTIMKCNPQIFDWYNRKYRLDFGGNQDYKGMKSMRRPIDGTNCELVREPGLGTSQRLICTPAENFVYGVDTANGYTMDVQKFNRSLKILIDLKAGVQLKEIHARALAVNDQA